MSEFRPNGRKVFRAEAPEVAGDRMRSAGWIAPLGTQVVIVAMAKIDLPPLPPRKLYVEDDRRAEQPKPKAAKAAKIAKARKIIRKNGRGK